MAAGLHPGYVAVSGGQSRGLQGPVAGIYVPVPVGSDLVIDLSDMSSQFVRITVVAEEVYYVFGQDPADVMVGVTSADYRFDFTALVPDIIGCGTSVREVVPTTHPYLLLRSATAVPGEVRIRRA